MFEGSPGGDVLYNTELVKPEQIRSYWNLLDPKFKGKIVSMDPTVAGPASQTVVFYYHSPELGPEFLRRLFSEMDVKVIREDERLIDWVAQKKLPPRLVSPGHRSGHGGKGRSPRPPNPAGPF